MVKNLNCTEGNRLVIYKRDSGSMRTNPAGGQGGTRGLWIITSSSSGSGSGSGCGSGNGSGSGSGCDSGNGSGSGSGSGSGNGSSSSSSNAFHPKTHLVLIMTIFNFKSKKWLQLDWTLFRCHTIYIRLKLQSS